MKLDVTNWKTYTNTDYGYSFKYPVDLKLDTSLSKLVEIQPLTPANPPFPFFYSIQVENNIGNTTAREYADGEYNNLRSAIFSPTTKVFVNNVTIDGVAGGKVTVTAKTDFDTMEKIYVVKNGKVYTITGTINADTIKGIIKGMNGKTIFNEILSTFKFTK